MKHVPSSELGAEPEDHRSKQVSAGAALISRMKTLGVDYVFANSGTDFPPVIEGIAEAADKNMPMPNMVTVPHETAAAAMAHGYYLATGRAQAVMVHTDVGLANIAMGALNAAVDQTPMLLISGRTPTVEKGRFGARTVPIGWGQEMFDQHALIREACKWDYELRFPEQVHELADRAYAIAASTPPGPVYLSLPREVLCEQVPDTDALRQPLMTPARTSPRPDDIGHAARRLAEAKNPVIVAQRGAGSQEAFDALTTLAGEWCIPVCQYWAVRLAVPTNHPMAASPAPGPLIREADVILVIDALAPWSPDDEEPRDDCTVIQMGPDPLFQRTPVRNFRCDIALPGEVAPTILALKSALDRLAPSHRGRNASRRRTVLDRNAVGRGTRRAKVAADRSGPQLTKTHVSVELSDMLKHHDAAVFAELGCQLPFMELRYADSWFESPHAGGLGWGFPAAMGYKLAKPDKTVVATLGDGSYVFANPVACHQIAEAHGLSIVVLVLNNSEWGAVRQSVMDLYPDGHAARARQTPLTGLEPSPDFTQIARASRAFARKAANEAELRQALFEALAHTEAGRGLALIEVAIARN
ncbi:MAG: thiamine pyrophosphate-requiring protein [Notoacmeibacter sp.]|nr:thiamine pyrophosphate-requiring protein [Notoacmeibacter sp.]